MPDLALDLRYLRLAILVAQHGSFRATAESQNLSQSTVSRRIRLLERRLGIVLFNRSRQGSELTPAGERFLRTAAIGAEHLQQAIIDTRRVHKGETGMLRIGVVTSITGGHLPGLLERYRRANPSVKISIEEISCSGAGAALVGDKIDVAFVLGEVNFAGCQTMKLWRERMVVALPKNHHLAGALYVDWNDLRYETFLAPANEQGADLEYFLIKKLPEECLHPDIAVHGVGRDSLLGMVARGFGVFVALDSTVSDAHKDVIFLPIGDDSEWVQLSAARRLRCSNPATKSFIELAASYLATGTIAESLHVSRLRS